MAVLLPSSVYQSPPRLGRGRQLNTILEDNEETNHSIHSDSEGGISDRTVIGRPAGLDAKYFLAVQQPRRHQARSLSPASTASSPGGDSNGAPSARSSYAGSDTGTVFSESCPSLTGSNISDSTSFATESTRTSIASRTSRNKYPALLIPRDSWGSVEGEVKQLPMGMSPSTKILLSPEVLRSIPQIIPELEDAPSLADTGSIRSASPYMLAMRSAPSTPDMHNLDISNGQSWGGHGHVPDTPLEIALDEQHSILLSPNEAHSTRYNHSRSQSDAWSEIMGHFPRIPGATPQDMTPVTPDIPRNERFTNAPPDPDSQLPAVALEVLSKLTRAPSPSLKSESTMEEMQERSVMRRPKSTHETPISEYSFSQLSIPSPGGFFSSLQAGARNTWASPPTRDPTPPPSSTTAENFYNTPWSGQNKITETVIVVAQDSGTDGPPTARQQVFDSGVKTPSETSDLYGSSTPDTTTPIHRGPQLTSFEYEEAYDEGIKKAAEVNLNRTGHWLAAQTTYLSALRETNPLNDPADYPIAVGAAIHDDGLHDSPTESEAQKAVRFLAAANKAATTPVIGTDTGSATSSPTTPTREPLFLEAFMFTHSDTRRRDTFLQSSARLQSIQTTRIALPKLHVKSLLNDHSSKSLTPQHTRPKYRGPFSQNPRATGVFDRSEEQDVFATLERQQLALAAILPNSWTVEAQSKILYNGRLLACKTAADRLTRKSLSNEPKGLRVLDLGGNATASWAWAAATKWKNIKVITVQSKAQSQLCTPSKSERETTAKPLNPGNHRVVTVPQLWQLPFKTGHFDVVSARTLHMYLRSTPIPGVSSIDEWDMTIKECMRVLKPGGILDYFVMDSGLNGSTGPLPEVVNLSPSAMTSSNASTTAVIDASKRKANATCAEFRNELTRRGYEIDGGCSRLMTRLKNEGFVGIKRQWVGLPMGRAIDKNTYTPSNAHSRTVSEASTQSSMSSSKVRGEPAYCYMSHFHPDGSSKKPFRLAPRPISEVSTISKIVDQYAGCEAVQGPVGSTHDVADMSSLLGEILWEEWLVRLRIEAGVEQDHLLDGVDETFEQWRRTGRAAWKGVVGWARKPSKKETKDLEIKQWKEQGRVPSPVERISVGLEVPSLSAPRSRSNSPARPDHQHHPHHQQPEMQMRQSMMIENQHIDTNASTPATSAASGYTTATATTAAATTAAAALPLIFPYQSHHHKYQAKQPRMSTIETYGYERIIQELDDTSRPINEGLQRNESILSHREFSQSAIERGDVGEIPFILMG